MATRVRHRTEDRMVLRAGRLQYKNEKYTMLRPMEQAQRDILCLYISKQLCEVLNIAAL